MGYDLSVLADFVGSLAVICVLAAGFGAIRRKVAGPNAAPTLLGLMFGLVAVIQMNAPLSPADGVIVDMRNVPVALAGAFLGARGLICCLLIAASWRIGLGGIGMMSGLASMLLAGLAGHLWYLRTVRLQRRGLREFLILAVAMNAHLAAVVMLPADIAHWFLTVAALPVIVLNLVSIPIASALLEREMRLLSRDPAGRANADTDPDSGLLTQAAFARDLAHRVAAGAKGYVAGLMVIELRRQRLISILWGPPMLGTIFGALRMRLEGLLQHGDRVGLTDGGQLLVALTAEEMMRHDLLAVDVRRALSSETVALSTGDQARVSVSVSFAPFPADAQLTRVLRDLRRSGAPPWKARVPARTLLPGSGHYHPFPPVAQDHMSLFEKANLLMAMESH